MNTDVNSMRDIALNSHVPMDSLNAQIQFAAQRGETSIVLHLKEMDLKPEWCRRVRDYYLRRGFEAEFNFDKSLGINW